MGWSQELNDFSEGFSSGMNMVRSREEREAEKLENERRRQQVEQHDYDVSRRPVLEGREQKLFDLDVQRQEGAIDQQEWERRRRDIEAGHEDTLFELGAERERGTLEQQGYERGQRPVKEGREQKLFDLEVQRQEGAIDQQEYDKSRREIISGQQDTLFELGVQEKEGTLETQKHERERRPTVEKQADELHELDVEGKKEIISGGKEDTRGKKLANDKLQKQQDLYDAYQKRRGKRGTLTNENEVPAAPTPGPQSAVEVPVESTATHDGAVDYAAPVGDEPQYLARAKYDAIENRRGDARSPETTQRLIKAYRDRDVQDTLRASDVALSRPAGADVEAAQPIEAPASALSNEEFSQRVEQQNAAYQQQREAEAVPATPAYGVPLPEGGPRAHPHVDRIQRSRAEQENTPAQKRLDDATVNVLEAAGAQTNTRAVITSGGTSGEPAQVRLYDMETNKPLDPNIPADRERMEAFNAAAQSAPSEITTTTSPLDHTGNVYKVAREAAMVGLDNAADKLGVKNQGAVDTPEYEQAARSFLLGEYGADVDQVEQAKAVVQEIAAEAGHELNEAEEAVHTIAYAYDSYMAAGMYAEAKEAATALVGHYTTLAGQFAAVAKAAVMEGELPAATEAAARAYANVPDGVGVDFNQTADGKYEVVMTNEETGEVTTRSILTPQEIGGLIMKIDPSHFLSTISQAAGKDLEETLSAEAAEQMGRPELAGLPRTEVATIQAEEKENRLRGGGAVGVEAGDEAGGAIVGTGEGFGKLSQDDLEGISTEIGAAFTSFAARNAAKNPESDKYTTQLDPTANSDRLAYIQPIAEQIAIDNFGKLRPALAAEAVIRMIDQEPTSVKPAKGGRFEVRVRGIDPFTISEGLYERLTDARIKYGPQPDGTEPAFRQGRDTRRAMGQLPMLPDYDPTRSRVVPSLHTTRRPSEAGPVVGPEAVPTGYQGPIVQAPPAVGGPVETPGWMIPTQLDKFMRDRGGGGGGPRKPQRLVPVR